MKSILFLILVSLTSLTIPSAFAEGGGGIDCEEISGAYTYLIGTAVYETPTFDEDKFGSLYCQFISDEPNIVQFGSIEAMFHIGGELSQQLIDEYGCGEKLGYEMSPLYVSSPTHFAVVTFSTSDLQNTAENILTLIEQQNLATICAEDSSGNSTPPKINEKIKKELEEIVKELDEPMEIIENVTSYLAELGIEDEENESVFQIVLPSWIKDNAGWWASDQITDDDFYSGIEYLISEGIIVIPPTEVGTKTSEDIPTWIKFNAGWWDEGLITDSEFIDGLQYLISAGIISVK